MPLADALSKLPPAPCYWVALSGGLDSTVLLHALVTVQAMLQTQPPASIRALHVHHGLSEHADHWLAACEALCADLGVPLESVGVKVEPRGRGLEDAAREARYRVFEQTLPAGHCLLTAHHGDDQAETLLLRLMRGSGPRGLAAMADSRALGRGCLHRPLLGVTRAQLEDYARVHHLQWVEDDSNTDERFDRNFLRAQVMPRLRQRWPGLARAWGESARLCAESEQLLGELAGEDLERAVASVVSSRPTLAPVLDITRLRELSPPRRHNLLRHWLRSQSLPVPGREHLKQIDQQLIGGREDSRARVQWEALELHRFRSGLYLLSSRWFDPGSDSRPRSGLAFTPDRGAALSLPDGGRLEAERAVGSAAGPGLPILRPGLGALTVRWREGGERCQPVGRAHSQALKKLLQEHDLEPWWRSQVPLVYRGDVLVAVGDLWVCQGFGAGGEEPGHRLIWRPPGSF